MSYAYFASTLPLLVLEGPPPFTAEAFLARCQEQLSAEHVEAVRALMGQGDSRHPFVVAWRNRETQFRNAIVKARVAKRQGVDAGPWLREHGGFDVWVEHGVVAAFQATDPLKRERALDQILWQLAGELAGPEPLTAQAIFAYAIRLQMTIRWSKVDATRGLERMMKLAKTPAVANDSTIS